MRRSKRSQRLIHTRRDVSTRRPMHITIRLREGLGSLREADVHQKFRQLRAGARQRGVRTAVYALMSNHIHWVVIPDSREALANAARYMFGQLARWLNKRWNRKGKVFDDRYHSEVGRSVRQAWQLIGYVLRNPHAAGLRDAGRGWDPYVGANETMLTTDPFLRSLFGPITRWVRLLLHRMTREPVPYTPLRTRLQPCLPGMR